MLLFLQCPACSKKLKPVPLAGKKKFRCPGCRKLFRLSQNELPVPDVESMSAESGEPRTEESKDKGRQVPWKTCLVVLFAFWAGLSLGHGSFRLGRTRPPSFASLEWKEYDFPTMKVKLSFPASPIVDDGARQKNGSLFVVRAEIPRSDLDLSLHIFQAGRLANRPPPTLEEVQQGILADHPGSSTISLGSVHTQYGRAFDIQIKTTDGYVLRRTLFTPRRVYLLTASGSDFVYHDQSIQHFLNSLRIDEVKESALPKTTVLEWLGPPKDLKGTLR